MGIAAIAPLVTSVAPSIIDLVTSLIHKAAPAAEATLGPGTGPIKAATVLSAMTAQLQQAATSGQIKASDIPSPDVLQVILNAVVKSMNLSGLLEASSTSTTPNQAITIKPGQSLTISVAS
jgi:hypothetical protein